MFKLAKRNNVNLSFNSVEEVRSAYNFKDLQHTMNKSKYLEFLGKYNKLTNNENTFDCPICFENVEKNKAYRILECGHKFHKTCIDKWLYSEEKNSCPMCRMELIPDLSDKSDKTAEIEDI